MEVATMMSSIYSHFEDLSLDLAVVFFGVLAPEMEESCAFEREPEEMRLWSEYLPINQSTNDP